jgi:organic hydroperoxide reductase OsmC/OhrA
MSTHKALIRWQFAGGDHAKGRYSREHTWTFDGGATIAASPAPGVVPTPWSNPAAVDPEEAFVASLSSCHMLTFLHLASRAGLQVLSYEDEAAGILTKNDAGERWVSSVVLHPKVTYAVSHGPGEGQEKQLHQTAHEQCFIANSVKTEVSVEPGVPG